MKLWAISDLHLANRGNRAALVALPARPEDWLIVAGDVGETEAHLRLALELLIPRFARLLWVPGNHDLWTLADDPSPLRGEASDGDPHPDPGAALHRAGLLGGRVGICALHADGNQPGTTPAVCPLLFLHTSQCELGL